MLSSKIFWTVVLFILEFSTVPLDLSFIFSLKISGSILLLSSCSILVLRKFKSHKQNVILWQLTRQKNPNYQDIRHGKSQLIHWLKNRFFYLKNISLIFLSVYLKLKSRKFVNSLGSFFCRRHLLTYVSFCFQTIFHSLMPLLISISLIFFNKTKEYPTCEENGNLNHWRFRIALVIYIFLSRLGLLLTKIVLWAESFTKTFYQFITYVLWTYNSFYLLRTL